MVTSAALQRDCPGPNPHCLGTLPLQPNSHKKTETASGVLVKSSHKEFQAQADELVSTRRSPGTDHLQPRALREHREERARLHFIL